MDTHSHLHFPAYKDDVAEVLARMKEKDIGTITIGTTLANSEAGARFAEAHENVWASAALHPEHLTSEFQDANEGEVAEKTLDVERLERIARSSPKIVAIGETGLDFHWIDEGLDREEATRLQEETFMQHAEVASKLDLPLIVHCRDASDRLTDILKRIKAVWPGMRGAIHSFSGSREEAEVFLSFGMHIGINGIVTFKPRKSDPLERQLPFIVERLPLDRILLETDAPYLAPVPYRGKRNEPVYVEEVARMVAEIKGITVEEVARITTENAIKLFRLA